MQNERRKHLEQTLKKFNKNQEDSIADFGSNKTEFEKISFGIPELDNLTAGGMKRGTFTEIYGGSGVGKSTLVQHIIANTQQKDLICCYVDLEHSFSKDRAIQLGIKLNDLVLAEKCVNAEQALELIRVLCKEKAVDLIVIDSLQGLSPKAEQEGKEGQLRSLESKEIAELARLLSKFYRIVAPDVFRGQVAVLIIGQLRIAGIGTFFTHATMSGGNARDHWASTRLFMRRGQSADAPQEDYIADIDTPDGIIKKKKKRACGFDVVLKLEKNKTAGAKENSEIHLPFYYESGFINPKNNNTKLLLHLETENQVTEELLSKGKDVTKDFNESQSIEVKPKKKRGRPKKNG